MLSKYLALLPTLLVAVLIFGPLAIASDRAIEGAVADIARFEKQAATTDDAPAPVRLPRAAARH